MHSLTLDSAVTIAYEDDYFGPAWVKPQVALLVHGIAESSRSWAQWVPVLSGELRVVRPDLPGFGSSSQPGVEYEWSPRHYATDLAEFVEKLGINRFHLVSAKYGGKIAMQFASSFPDRVLSLSIFSSPANAPGTGTHEVVGEKGVVAWATATMPKRLGSAADAAQVRWWTDQLMGRADPRSVIGCTSLSNSLDISDQLPGITAPTLVVTTTQSGLQDVREVERYQGLIPNSRLAVLEGDCYHPAAVEPLRCAGMALDFIHETTAPSGLPVR